MKYLDIESMLYHVEDQKTDMWELKREQLLYEQQNGNYSFIVIENKRKNVKLDSFKELELDTYVRE